MSDLLPGFEFSIFFNLIIDKNFFPKTFYEKQLYCQSLETVKPQRTTDIGRRWLKVEKVGLNNLYSKVSVYLCRS